VIEKPVVGFIGLGLMGHGMAKNIRQAGYGLWVRGRNNRKPVESLLSMGAGEAASPKDMAAKCDIIHICLSSSEQVEDVVCGEDGILAGARPGLIVVDTSTADPGSTVILAKELTAKGAHMVDAPLGRTPKEAEEGRLDAMLGCDLHLANWLAKRCRSIQAGSLSPAEDLSFGSPAEERWIFSF
jgi:3-hydroxyisobutyrate dehydrogenase-like beta-hydroxyacid dehydrogenase